MNRLKQNPQSIAQDLKNYHWMMFRHMMEFLKQCTSLKKPLPEHYFISLFKDLSNKDLVTLCGLLATKIKKPKRKLYAILGRRAWVPQHKRNKVLHLPVNRRMIKLPPKPKEVWDSQKRQCPNP
jgi:hypothetical protein